MTAISKPLGELCTFINGVTFSSSECIDYPRPSYVPILRAGNIQETLNVQNDLVWVPENRVAPEQIMKEGDIAICLSSGSSLVVGKTAILEEKFTR